MSAMGRGGVVVVWAQMVTIPQGTVRIVKSVELQSQSYLPLTHCVTSGMCLKHTKFQFLYLENGSYKFHTS